MSLEQHIAANTAAIRDLITAMENQTAIKQKPEPVAVKPEAVKQKPEPEELTTEVAGIATYEDVKKAIQKVAGVKSRDELIALLAKFGATRGPDIHPTQFAQFVLAASELMDSSEQYDIFVSAAEERAGE